MLRVAQLERAKPKRSWFRRRSKAQAGSSEEPRRTTAAVFEAYAVTFQMEP